MKKNVIGLLAHVDAGKTTLAEALVYKSGKTRQLGRVDSKNAYLDTEAIEKSRGITVFSKQAILQFEDYELTLLDTPGHVDFSAEMERVLGVLDYALLIISGAEGIQSHTMTLWRLLEAYEIPVFIFVNKMDRSVATKDKITIQLREMLSHNCIAFDTRPDQHFFEQLALCHEHLLSAYLEDGLLTEPLIQEAIYKRWCTPVYFGSALKLEGIENLIEGLSKHTQTPAYPDTFGARIFKITRDTQGNRLTHLKVTGGVLKVKDTLTNGERSEKINQIRRYSGDRFETASQVSAGSICAVTGLNESMAGRGFGYEPEELQPLLEPVLAYRVLLPVELDPRVVLPKLRIIEEESPELKIAWQESHQEIQVQVMGEIQLEVLTEIMIQRFGIPLDFDEGRIVYKETILNTVEGVGHFEPLKHYAEVHLILSPGEPGTGLRFESAVSEDDFPKKDQNLVLSHLKEKRHFGVLTGSEITDMTITLVAGKGHVKHTEGGDFREATYRAVRQGLSEAENVLLEPYYQIQFHLPETYVGKVMTDIETRHGKCEITSIQDGFATITGMAPASTMRNYQKDVLAYSRGLGQYSVRFGGYGICHDQAEVIESIGYESEADVENPTGSIFCESGVGEWVPWFEVKQKMHLDSVLKQKSSANKNPLVEMQEQNSQSIQLSLDEIESIIASTYRANQGKKKIWTNQKSQYQARQEMTEERRSIQNYQPVRERFLLVDGYNVIFAWDELKELAEAYFESSRVKLMDILADYQSMIQRQIIVVFDAYRVPGRNATVEDYHNIKVVYTAEAQTADQYIEKFAHMKKAQYDIMVVTSDGLQQMIIRGAGAGLMSARELKEDVEQRKNAIGDLLKQNKVPNKATLDDSISPELISKIKHMNSK